ncbi:PTS system trehalose-specific EIIBC component [Bacillus carboniphilus]|uniref:protein-N(pi)-phosphohistidine--sucrose phosphotransferase n=1 Tax=Bacillus carboniphilus TaxID=86663 RepID=A0ABN0VV57_9BACI
MSVNKESVREIIEAVGGKENIAAATHCVTRLRFALKDEAIVDKEKLENIDLVKGAFSASGQYQVVIGQGTVDKVYKELAAQTGIEHASKEDVKNEAAQKLNPLQRAIKTLADIFIPILPAIVTAGLLMGINNLLTADDLFYDGTSVIAVHPQWADLAGIINLIANTAFTFLPALIGWSAVKKFGGNPVLGIVLGSMLVHPELLNAWGYGSALQEGNVPTWNILGMTVEKVGYQGQVLPVLVASYLLAKIEIFLRNRVHDSIQLLVVGPVALLVTGFLAFLFIGPVTFAIGNMITDAVVTVFDNFSIIGGLLYGGLYAVLVITGMHHTFLPIDLQLLSSGNGTFLWPILVMSNIAQGSAALAMMYVGRKNEKLRGLALTSGISAYMGITEPAMFGVNLRYRYAFISGIVSSAIAGAFISFFGVRANSIGVGGLPGILSIMQEYWIVFAIGMLISIVLPFVLTILFAKIKGEKIQA